MATGGRHAAPRRWGANSAPSRTAVQRFVALVKTVDGDDFRVLRHLAELMASRR